MAGHKILVIDDSKVIRMRVRDMLPAGDFQILEAKDGIEGLNLIHQERPNLIMLDFLLPRKSGWDVYQDLQLENSLKSIPLVIMSGRKEEVTDKLPEPFEFFEFIEKPFEKQQLQAAIKEAIKKSKQPRIQTPDRLDTARLTNPGVDAAEVVALNQKIELIEGEIASLTEKNEALEGEITSLKRALTQLVNFVKQNLKEKERV